jgi:2-haloacid dehalogenase
MWLWFANFIMYSALVTVARQYVPFTDIEAAVMKMLADTRGIKIEGANPKELTERFSTMPPHPEVPAVLRKLRRAGFRLLTLTDNLLEIPNRGRRRRRSAYRPARGRTGIAPELI